MKIRILVIVAGLLMLTWLGASLFRSRQAALQPQTDGQNLVSRHDQHTLDPDIATLQRQYIGAGDSSSAETLAQYGLQLSEHLSTGEGAAFLSTSSWAMPWSASS